MALHYESEICTIDFIDYYFYKKEKSMAYVDRTPKMG